MGTGPKITRKIAVVSSFVGRSALLRFRARFLSLALLGIGLSLGASTARANDVYIAQAAAGAATGADCADALAYTYFNTSGSWTSGTPTGIQIGPGTTVHVCGTITGAAGATGLTFQGSGTSGNPITLLFESGAVLAAPYWSSNGAIYTNGKSYLIVDGGSNGTVENTANGSGLAYNTGSNLVGVVGSSNVTVEHLTASDSCQHTSDTDTTGCNQEAGGIAVSGGASNVTVTRNTVHDAATCVWYAPASGDGSVTVSYNTISRCNWGIGSAGTLTTGPFTITGNDITCVAGGTCNWDTTTDTFHHNGVMIYPQGTVMNGIIISDNYFHDINGWTTAFIFLDPASPGDTAGALIYNNVFYTTPGQSGGGLGNIAAGFDISGGTGFCQACKILNNTTISNGYGFAGDNVTAENNIVENAFWNVGIDSGATGDHMAYNDYYGWNANGGWPTGNTLAGWQSGSGNYCSGGCDVTGSIAGNPLLSATFTLDTGSPAIGAGTNLTSLGISGLDVGAPQYFGVNYACGNGCVARPATGAWDMGAYPAGSSTGSTQPTPPSNLTDTVH